MPTTLTKLNNPAALFTRSEIQGEGGPLLSLEAQRSFPTRRAGIKRNQMTSNQSEKTKAI